MVIFSKLISEPACSSQVDFILHWASPHLPWGMQRICGCFLEFIHVFRFCQPACFFAARFTLRQPKTSVRNKTNVQTFYFEDYHYAFQETLCPVTLDLCILFKFISISSNTFRPILASFSHILLYTNLYYHAKYFSFIVLIQWIFPWNISANLLIFTNKASRLCCYCVIKVKAWSVPKLLAPSFSIAESILNL